MATTTPDNLYSPDGSNAYNIPAETGAMQTSVQAALSQRANFYRGTSTQRVALSTAGLAQNGTYWSDTNGTQELYRYSGSAWVSQTPAAPDTTAWTTVLAAGASGSNGFAATTAVECRRLNGVVFLSGELTNSSTSSSALTALTLPVGFRPRTRIHGYLSATGLVGTVDASYRLLTTGELQIQVFNGRGSSPGYVLGAIGPYLTV